MICIERRCIWFWWWWVVLHFNLKAHKVFHWTPVILKIRFIQNFFLYIFSILSAQLVCRRYGIEKRSHRLKHQNNEFTFRGESTKIKSQLAYKFHIIQVINKCPGFKLEETIWHGRQEGKMLLVILFIIMNTHAVCSDQRKNVTIPTKLIIDQNNRIHNWIKCNS